MRTFDVPRPIDLLASLSPLVASANDPTVRLRADRIVRASWTPDGPVTLDVRQTGNRHYTAEAVGPGRDWALDHAPALLGGDDDLDGFAPHLHPVVARAHHQRPGLRLIRSGRIQDVLVPTILGQRVTAQEAARSWTRIVRTWGRPAPGDAGLRLPPPARELAGRPWWAFHELGVERSRATRIATACRRLPALERILERTPDPAPRRPGDIAVRGDRTPTIAEQLQRCPGIGPWTAALVARVSAGDPDTVEVGDYHVKHHVVHALTGAARGSDAQMLELLAPFAGHRGRVVRLLTSSRPRPPTFGPRHRILPLDKRDIPRTRGGTRTSDT